MKKHIQFLSFASACAVAALFSGCGSNAQYVDTQGTQTIVSLDQINIQDWSNAADQMVASLLTSGVLDNAPSQPAIMAVTGVTNNTSTVVDTALLTKNIRVALTQSGKVLTTTTYGLQGTAVEDPLARQTMELYKLQNNDASSMPLPYYTLSGKLLENRAQSGRTRQVTYTFQLTLTQINTGLAVWEEVVNITKQGTRPSVGW